MKLTDSGVRTPINRVKYTFGAKFFICGVYCGIFILAVMIAYIINYYY